VAQLFSLGHSRVMRFPATERTKAKRHVMRIVEPALLELGFTKVSTTEFAAGLGKDEIGWLLVSLPLHSEYYRVQVAVSHGSASIASGPHSDPYGCPDSPNGKRYNFRLFHPSPETFDRCAQSIIRWVEEVAIPWFKTEPRVSGLLPWPNQSPEPTAVAAAVAVPAASRRWLSFFR